LHWPYVSRSEGDDIEFRYHLRAGKPIDATYLPTWEFRVCLPLALSSLKCDVMLKVKEITVIYIRHAHGLDRYDECTVLLDEYRFLSVTSVTGKIFL
jgi:hypothetical protein